MTAHRKDLPVHAPIAAGRLDSAFVRDVLGRREARQRMAAASAEVEEIFASARAEAETILSRLPDFAALKAAKAGRANALSIIRGVADAAGVPVAVVTGHTPAAKALPLRNRAIRALADAGFEADAIARLFAGARERTVEAIIDRGRK